MMLRLVVFTFLAMLAVVRADMAECFSSEEPMLNCLTRVLPTKPECPQGTTLISLLAQIDEDECCLKCRPRQPGNCQDVSQIPCDLSGDLKDMSGLLSNLFGGNFCPKCNIKQLVIDRSWVDECKYLELEKCASGELPKISNGCPTCRIGAPKCQRKGSTKCAPPDCLDDVYPTLDKETCCPTCKLGSALLAKAEACKAKIGDCVNGLAGKPKCGAKKVPQFSTDTCCVDCLPNGLPMRASAAAKCAVAELKACLNEVPTCEDDDLSVAPELSCCKLCKRPEWKCAPSEVVSCFESVPECGVNEKPMHMDGACCTTCKPAPPNCSPTCPAGKMCVGANVCKNATELRLQLGVDGALLNVMRGFNAEKMKDYVLEVFERFCDLNENTAKCEQARESIQAMQVKEFGVRAAVRIIFLLSNDSVTTSARGVRTFAAETTSSTVLQEALSSSVAQEGDTTTASVTTFEGDIGAASVSGPHTTWLFLAALLALLLSAI